MAIHIEQQNVMQDGFDKEIDEAGISMIFDTAQKYQYSYPIKSTVREILCNGVDSLAEKKMALEILSGHAKVEDYFVDLEGAIYKDSKWKPEYYDPQWLNEQSIVRMQYIVGNHMKKDQVIISDTGVGLGGKRLEGYFKLAFSTKRLSRIPIGKWGLGAKAPLSIGVDFYTVESRYNGMLFRFNIHSNTYYSLIPEWNLSTGRRNEFILFNEGKEKERKVFWEPTDLKNGLTVVIEAKKHHQQQYIDAVKSQMSYFDDIILEIVEEEGKAKSINYKSNILYEDDKIVLSDNQYYSKPHLLLNRVNYGYINWEELELQDMTGNIGIKVAPEDIEVNPSRESVLWTEKTKEKVLERFKDVVGIATEKIQEELKDTDLLKWIKTCYSISGRWGDNKGIVGRLANIVDLSKIEPKFGPFPRVVFKQSRPLPGIYTRYVASEVDTSHRSTKKKVKREEWQNLSSAFDKPFLLLKKEEGVSNRKDKYLLTLYPQGFVQMHEPPGTEEQRNMSDSMQKFYEKQEGTHILWAEIWDYITKSRENIIWYSEVEVPDSFKGNDEEEETEEAQTEEDVQMEQIARTSAEERRRLEGKTIVQTPRTSSGRKFVESEKAYKYTPFEYQKIEIPIKDINDWNAQEIYYGTDADAGLLELVGLMTAPHKVQLGVTSERSYASDYIKWQESKWFRKNKDKMYGVTPFYAYTSQHFFDADVMLVKVSQANTRYYRDFEHVQNFFIKIKNKTITMSNRLIKWNTARLIKTKLDPARFLSNFSALNPAYTEMYRRLREYVEDNYRDISSIKNDVYGMDAQTYDDLLTHMDNVHKFQTIVAKGMASPEEMARIAQDLFGNRELKDGMAVDPEMMALLEDVLEYSVACGPLFNYIPIFTAHPSNSSVPEDLEREVRIILDNKGILDYKPRAEREIDEAVLDITSALLPMNTILRQEQEPEDLSEEGVLEEVPMEN